MFRGATVIWCLIVLNMAVDAQRDSRWTWSSSNRNNVDGSIDRSFDRLPDRRKYAETLEDFRDRYEVNEQTTRKPISNNDDFYNNNNNNGFGFNGASNSITGNGYNSNGFGPFVPQGLGSPNNFNYPPYGNQFNGPFNPGFGYPNNYRPGPNNFYPNAGGFPSNFGNAPIYPGAFGPNRNPYNPLGNSPANGVLVGPGGPTGIYGRPPNYNGQNQLPFNGINPIGPFGNGYFNNFGGGGGGVGGGFAPIPFNSKAGAGISAENDDPKGRTLDKKPDE